MKPTLKQSFLLLPILFAVFAACSKTDEVVPPDTAPIADTSALKAGWTRDSSFRNRTYLNDVVFNKNGIGYMSSADSLFVSTDSGQTWKGKWQPSIANLWTTETNVYWATTAFGSIHKMNVNGSNQAAVFISNSNNAYADIYFCNSIDGFVFTSQGDFFNTSDAGQSWQKMNSVPSSYKVGATIHMFNAGKGVAANGHEVFRFDADSAKWLKSVCTPLITDYCQSVAISMPAASVAYLSLSNGSLYKSTDAGKEFIKIKDFGNADLKYPDVHFLDENLGYVACKNVIYKTEDGGKTWQADVTLPKNANLLELHFTDAKHGWACGENGLYLRYKG